MLCAALQVQAVGEKLHTHIDGNIAEKELPDQPADQAQTLAEAPSPSKSLAEADVAAMPEGKDDMTTEKSSIKTQSQIEKSKDKLFNFEAKLRQVQLGPSALSSRAQVNRGIT